MHAYLGILPSISRAGARLSIYIPQPTQIGKALKCPVPRHSRALSHMLNPPRRFEVPVPMVSSKDAQSTGSLQIGLQKYGLCK